MMSAATPLKQPLRQPVQEVPFLLRIVWFFVLGLEVTAVWILVAWALNLTIIGLPLGLWMIDRVPQVLTLKSRSGSYVVDPNNGHAHYLTPAQAPTLFRLGYFLLIGWWLSFFWAVAAWFFCATVIGLPIGVLMLHALPFVTTLHQN